MPKEQPVSGVEWVDPATLRANAYNPNKVFSPEMRLLKLSLLEDGWTMPVVAGEDDEIIDGFHRWTLASTDEEVRALTGGLVPVVRLPHAEDPAKQRLATVRHNRARGQHHVLKMADIVNDLTEAGYEDAEVGRRLGMDSEEVARLKARGNVVGRHGNESFNAGWTPEA